jgi:glycine/D-amino acid oxidase-like deaminating enzyme
MSQHAKAVTDALSAATATTECSNILTSTDSTGMMPLVPKKPAKPTKPNSGKSTADTTADAKDGKAGRPPLAIDAEQVKTLRSYGHTTQEIADFFSCHVDTIYTRFSDEIRAGRALFLNNLRKAQMREALKGNARLLVHLGKSNFDEQKPVTRLEHSGRNGAPIVVTDDPKEVERIYNALMEERDLIKQAGA